MPAALAFAIGGGITAANPIAAIAARSLDNTDTPNLQPILVGLQSPSVVNVLGKMKFRPAVSRSIVFHNGTRSARHPPAAHARHDHRAARAGSPARSARCNSASHSDRDTRSRKAADKACGTCGTDSAAARGVADAVSGAGAAPPTARPGPTPRTAAAPAPRPDLRRGLRPKRSQRKWPAQLWLPKFPSVAGSRSLIIAAASTNRA